MGREKAYRKETKPTTTKRRRRGGWVRVCQLIYQKLCERVEAWAMVGVVRLYIQSPHAADVVRLF